MTTWCDGWCTARSTRSAVKSVIFPHPAGQVDGRLTLVFGRMFLGVAVEDGALGSPGPGSGTVYWASGAAEQPRDHAVLTFPDRRRRALAARIARSTASMATFPARGGVRLPAGDQAPLRDCRVAVVRCRACPMAW